MGNGMSKSIRKKQEERFQLESFLNALALPTSVIEEREAPDFIVCLGKRKIGIELTNLFIHYEKNARLRQARESISEKIVSQALRLYQESLAQPVDVSVLFSPSVNADIGVLYKNNLSERLFTLVQKMNLRKGETLILRPEVFEDSPLPEEISLVQAQEVPNYKMARWQTVRAGLVATLTPKALQERIDDKSKKLIEYQKVVPENRLVITTSKSIPSQMFSVPAEFDSGSVISPFSKTFYYDYEERKLIELGT